jgi:hypothetical protein
MRKDDYLERAKQEVERAERRLGIYAGGCGAVRS